MHRLLSVAIVVGFLGYPTISRAQMAPPNDAGVTLSHVHLLVADVDAQVAFWTTMMDGRVVAKAPLTVISVPGAFIVLEKAVSTGPSAGTAVDHFGFLYKDLPAQLARWKAAGADARTGANGNSGYVWGPDGVRVEYGGVPELSVPAILDHIHMMVPDIPAAKAWYEKAFGATPGQRQRMSGPGIVECSYISPRITISFNPTRAGGTPLAATKGRVNDHFGFDVRNLDAFIKRLQDAGMTLDGAPVVLAGTKVRSVFVTDPVGARIEVTENFASLASLP